MSKWIDFYNVHSEYESDVVDATSDFDFYIADIEHKYENNNGKVVVELRISNDNGETWTDWININNGSYHSLFEDDGFPINQSFQYRVVMDVIDIGGESPVFDFMRINLTGCYKIINTGDVVCKPELWIKKKNGSGSIKLINETNGQIMEFQNLNDGETVYVDCENEDIITDLPLKYRYNDHNDVFIEFEVGENLISGEGDFELDMRFQFKTSQG